MAFPNPQGERAEPPLAGAGKEGSEEELLTVQNGPGSGWGGTGCRLQGNES